jgi:hypothetical protein
MSWQSFKDAAEREGIVRKGMNLLQSDLGHKLLTDDEASDLADELSAAGPFCFELPSYEAVTSRQWMFNRIHPTDAAREASHGYDPGLEARQDAADDADVCERCLGSGWFDMDEWSIECDCQQEAS